MPASTGTAQRDVRREGEQVALLVVTWSDPGTLRGVSFAAGNGSYDLVPFTITL